MKKKYFPFVAFLFLATLFSSLWAIHMEEDLRESYRFRRHSLLEKVGVQSVALLIGGGFERERDMDFYPFRQNSDFYYLTGLSQKKVALLLYWEEGKKKEKLYLLPRNPWAETWMGKSLYPGKESAIETGLAETVSIEKLSSDLKQLLSEKRKTLYTNGPQIAPAFWAQLQVSSGWEIQASAPSMAKLRLLKTPDEMRLIQKAIDITIQAHRRAMARARPYMYEYELQAEIEYIFLKNGAIRPAFTSILGSGPNSCTLHYNQNTRQILPGELVIMDIGAEYKRYAADITRTIPISGKFTARQKEIYNIVLGAQEAAFLAVKPGNTIRDVHQAAVEYISKYNLRHRFLHGTSHWMGLDVHDAGPYDATFTPGMVLTVEPGIYIPEENIGIRIEDDVMVTSTGYQLLSKDLPRKAEEIEALMAKKGEPALGAHK